MKYTTYKIYKCPRCKFMRWNPEPWSGRLRKVGWCAAKKCEVKEDPDIGLKSPALDCKDWVKGKPKVKK